MPYLIAIPTIHDMTDIYNLDINLFRFVIQDYVTFYPRFIYFKMEGVYACMVLCKIRWLITVLQLLNPKEKEKEEEKKRKTMHLSFFQASKLIKKKNKVRMIDQSHACNICNANEMVLMVHAWCPWMDGIDHKAFASSWLASRQGRIPHPWCPYYTVHPSPLILHINNMHDEQLAKLLAYVCMPSRAIHPSVQSPIQSNPIQNHIHPCMLMIKIRCYRVACLPLVYILVLHAHH